MNMSFYFSTLKELDLIYFFKNGLDKSIKFIVQVKNDFVNWQRGPSQLINFGKGRREQNERGKARQGQNIF
jgi:hypothetical protein